MKTISASYSRLLALGGVFPPMENFFTGAFVKLRESFLYATLVLLAAAAFVLIIYSAFAVRQIKNQAAWHVPSVGGDAGTDPGVRSGWKGSGCHCFPLLRESAWGSFYSPHGTHLYPEFWETLFIFRSRFCFSLGTAMTAAFASFLTVLVSASLPAKKMALSFHRWMPYGCRRMRRREEALSEAPQSRARLGLFGVEGVMA